MRTPKLKPRLLALYIAPLWLFLITATSCEQKVPQPGCATGENCPANEKIDISIQGSIDKTYHLQSPNGLVSFRQRPDYVMNNSEYTVSLDLGDDQLDLTLYNAALTNPLTSLISYSAYPMQVLADKETYVIAEWKDRSDKVTYSTTFVDGPPLLQPEVFRITYISSGYYSVKLRDLNLFSTAKIILRNESDFREIPSIRIDGTFTGLR